MPDSDGSKPTTPPAGRPDREAPRAAERTRLGPRRPPGRRGGDGTGRTDGASVLDPARDAESLLDDAAANTRALIETTTPSSGPTRSTRSSAPRSTRSAARSAGPTARTGRSTPRRTPWPSRWIGRGRRRVPAAHPDRPVPRGRGAQRPGLAAARPGLRRGPRPSSAIAAAPRWPAAPGSARASALPVLRDGQVIGTMDFFAMTGRGDQPDPPRALRTIGRVASDKIAKLGQAARAGPDHADGRERAAEHDVHATST